MVSKKHDLTQSTPEGKLIAFSELVRLHQSGVFNVAYRLLGEQRDAEDAAQETFIRAFRSINSLDPSRPPGPWLKKIAVNVCLDRLAKKESLNLDDEKLAIYAHPTEEHFPVETQVIEQERNSQIRLALQVLPPHYRAVIELRHFQELNYQEMAATLNRTLSDIKSDLFRARKLLADHLKVFL